MQDLVNQIKADVILSMNDKLDILRKWIARIDKHCMSTGIISSDDLKQMQENKVIIKTAITELENNLKGD